MGRWLWRGPANSDGADDGATDQWAAGETRQIPGVGPRRQTVGLGSAEQPKGSATWGSDCAAPGPRPPAGVGEGQPSRPGTSRPRATASSSWGKRQNQAVGRSLQRGGAGRAQAKAGCSHSGKTASAAPCLSQNTLETGAPTTQVQERHVPAPRFASQQRSSRAPLLDSGTPRGGDSPWPHPLRAAYLSGAWRLGRPAPSGRSERAGPPPAYKSGAALQLAQFSLRPVTRTLRETHHPDSPW